MSDRGSTQAADLAAFLKSHVRPYNPVTDDYERQPFAADIKEGKTDSVYTLHQYHTKVPPRAIVPYILHYTQPGDLVLDVFCGSGMTGVAAQMCAEPPADIVAQFPEFTGQIGARACILNDLSPAACHIAHNYNTPVDVDALKREFERIKGAVKDELHWLYESEHYEPAVGLYDVSNAEVASRLKNPPGGKSKHNLLEENERCWELLTTSEVEARLGYPVAALPPHEDWADLDLAKTKQWICIPATIQYTIWSDVYRCEGFVTTEEPTGKTSTRGKNAGKPMVRKSRVARGCGGRINLWDAAVDPITGEVAETMTCPNPGCGQIWNKISVRRCDVEPVITKFAFFGLNRRKNSNELKASRFERRISRKELARISAIQKSTPKHWLPSQPLDPSGPQYSRNALRARHIKDVRDFYTRRNLTAISALWEESKKCKHAEICSRVQFAITAIALPMTRMYVYRASRKGGVMNASLYFPSLTQEMNVGIAFSNKVPQIVAAEERRLSSEPNCIVTLGSADTLNIPDATVDYIFTDPPFGSNIYYSEASCVWEGWLNQFTDRKQEGVVHRKNDGGFKRIEDYRTFMTAAFTEMFRVLKPGRWATVEFNNSDGSIFEAVKQAIRDAGFEIVNMLLIDKEQKTFKQSKGAAGEEDVVDKDILFNLHKAAVVRPEIRADVHDLESQVAEAVRQHLATLPERIGVEPAKYSDDHRTTATINSMLMNTLIPKGVSVDRLNLPFIERVCGRFFRKIGQRWYLRGEAVGGNGGELVAEEVTVADEITAIAWLRQQLQGSPKLIGEIKPLWMRATGLLPGSLSQTLVLETLLRENFWRDAASNRWREPTPEEREKINDDRALRVLHDADRLSAGTLGRTPAGRELCEWISVLFDTCKELAEGNATAETHPGFDVTEAYQLIVKLSHHLTLDGVEPGALSAAQKQVRVAGQRLAAAAEITEAAGSKRTRRPEDDKQTVLEF